MILFIQGNNQLLIMGLPVELNLKYRTNNLSYGQTPVNRSINYPSSVNYSYDFFY